MGLVIPDVPVQQKFYEDFGLIGSEIEIKISLGSLINTEVLAIQPLASITSTECKPGPKVLIILLVIL